MTILDQIAAQRRKRLSKEMTLFPREVMRELAEKVTRTSPSFHQALSGKYPAFICELKKASPSKGVLTPVFDYKGIARDYERGGADAFSILTEPDYFQGNNHILRDLTRQTPFAPKPCLPALRKDFILDEWQIDQSRVLGASAILLIVSLLTRDQLARFLTRAKELELDVLVETHDEREVDQALNAGAKIVGVNNRNLHTFEVDLETSLRLRRRVPHDILFVAESGIHGRNDIERLAAVGVNAVLVGEALVTSADRVQTLRLLKGECL